MSDRMGKAIYGERLKKLGLVCFPGEDTTELSLRKRQKPWVWTEWLVRNEEHLFSQEGDSSHWSDVLSLQLIRSSLQTVFLACSSQIQNMLPLPNPSLKVVSALSPNDLRFYKQLILAGYHTIDPFIPVSSGTCTFLEVPHRSPYSVQWAVCACTLLITGLLLSPSKHLLHRSLMRGRCDARSSPWTPAPTRFCRNPLGNTEVSTEKTNPLGVSAANFLLFPRTAPAPRLGEWCPLPPVPAAGARRRG